MRDGRIAAMHPRSGNLPGGFIVPGFIDLHVHGGGGAQCNTSEPEEVAAVARFHLSRGTTGLVATTVAAPLGELAAALGAIARCPEPSVLGAHLEGPFLSPKRPGAMDGASFLAPSADTLARLLAAGQGRVRVMTLAPELTGALELVVALGKAGVLASLGHSEATYAEAVAAVQLGAGSVTHVFNAMRGLHHREPGMLGAALDCDGLDCELICDGLHVDPAAARVLHRVKGSHGMHLVTDATEAAGMADGEYRLGAARVSVHGGRAVIAGTATIAGSVLTMDAAVRNAVRFLGVSVEAAVAMASTGPARLLGLSGRKGSLVIGADADLVVLDPELRVRGVMLGGAWAGEPAL